MRSMLLVMLGWAVLVPVAAAQSEDEEEGSTAMDMAEEHMDDERARAHFQAGRSLYQAGAFERAGQEWEEAYRLSERPELLYNVYVAYRDAGDLRKAREALRRYLEEMEDPPDRVNLEARLRSLDEQVAALDAAEQAREEQDEETGGGGESEGAGGEPPPPPPPEESGGSVAPFLVMGVGGAALIAGAVTGVLALGKVGEIEDQCEDDLCPPDFDLEEEREDARTLVRMTDFLLLGGAVVAGAGLAWLLLDGGGDEEQAPVSAGCGPTGCMAEIRGTF